MYPAGREALLQDPTVVGALQQVVAEGWTDEVRRSAESALAALSDRQPDVAHAAHHCVHRHVMLSYQWDVQKEVNFHHPPGCDSSNPRICLGARFHHERHHLHVLLTSFTR